MCVKKNSDTEKKCSCNFHKPRFGPRYYRLGVQSSVTFINKHGKIQIVGKNKNRMYEFTPMYPDHIDENLKWLEYRKWCAPVVSPPDCYHSTRCKIIFTLFSPTSWYKLYMTLICIAFSTNIITVQCWWKEENFGSQIKKVIPYLNFC